LSSKPLKIIFSNIKNMSTLQSVTMINILIVPITTSNNICRRQLSLFLQSLNTLLMSWRNVVVISLFLQSLDTLLMSWRIVVVIMQWSRKYQWNIIKHFYTYVNKYILPNYFFYYSRLWKIKMNKNSRIHTYTCISTYTNE